jgi:hypothetical protein
MFDLKKVENKVRGKKLFRFLKASHQVEKTNSYLSLSLSLSFSLWFSPEMPSAALSSDNLM